ncbi:hypothetical protein B0H17DRAFT_1126828 [Mycena rosella]|uniref:Uncharacterized protein n=1 Tax=Mycena rosella TaxID=1033263 RepID=A0AAD7GSS8_MYCRO|nr:hypothetical protein B0H17DRAFT_1126828 [Mycena rosella]
MLPLPRALVRVPFAIPIPLSLTLRSFFFFCIGAFPASVQLTAFLRSSTTVTRRLLAHAYHAPKMAAPCTPPSTNPADLFNTPSNPLAFSTPVSERTDTDDLTPLRSDMSPRLELSPFLSDDYGFGDDSFLAALDTLHPLNLSMSNMQRLEEEAGMGEDDMSLSSEDGDGSDLDAEPKLSSTHHLRTQPATFAVANIWSLSQYHKNHSYTEEEATCTAPDDSPDQTMLKLSAHTSPLLLAAGPRRQRDAEVAAAVAAASAGPSSAAPTMLPPTATSSAPSFAATASATASSTSVKFGPWAKEKKKRKVAKASAPVGPPPLPAPPPTLNTLSMSMGPPPLPPPPATKPKAPQKPPPLPPSTNPRAGNPFQTGPTLPASMQFNDRRMLMPKLPVAARSAVDPANIFQMGSTQPAPTPFDAQPPPLEGDCFSPKSHGGDIVKFFEVAGFEEHTLPPLSPLSVPPLLPPSVLPPLPPSSTPQPILAIDAGEDKDAADGFLADDSGAPPRGRPSAATKEVLANCYNTMLEVLEAAHQETGYSGKRILDGFLLHIHSETTRSTNDWNRYQRYTNRNAVTRITERRHLNESYVWTGGEDNLPPALLVDELCRTCQVFQEHYKDRHKRMRFFLTRLRCWKRWNERRHLPSIKKPSTGRRKRSGKRCLLIDSQMQGLFTDRKFQGLLILVGSHVNEDAELGTILSTGGLFNLPNSLKFKEADLLGVAKTIAFLRASTSRFCQPPLPPPFPPLPLAPPFLPPTPPPPRLPKRSSRSNQISTMMSARRRGANNTEDVHKIQDLMASAALEDVGVNVFRKLQPINGFTWTCLDKVLSANGMRILGYPSSIRLPGEFPTDKGSSRLSQLEREAIRVALGARVLVKGKFLPEGGLDAPAIVTYWQSSGGARVPCMTGEKKMMEAHFDLDAPNGPLLDSGPHVKKTTATTKRTAAAKRTKKTT